MQQGGGLQASCLQTSSRCWQVSQRPAPPRSSASNPAPQSERCSASNSAPNSERCPANRLCQREAVCRRPACGPAASADRYRRGLPLCTALPQTQRHSLSDTLRIVGVGGPAVRADRHCRALPILTALPESHPDSCCFGGCRRWQLWPHPSSQPAADLRSASPVHNSEAVCCAFDRADELRAACRRARGSSWF